MILAIDHQHRWADIAWIARLGAGFGLPTVGKHRTQLFDLLGILVRRAAGQSHFLPIERSSRLQVARHQARRIGVGQVRHNEDGAGVFERAGPEVSPIPAGHPPG